MNLRAIMVSILRATRLNRPAHRLYYRFFHGFDSATRSTLQGLDMAFAKARELGTLAMGDYYEFGLFKGYSFYYAHRKARECRAEGLRFFGFDSFEGLPALRPEESGDGADFYQGQYACAYDAVCAELKRKGIDWDRTVLVKGYFNDSLTDALRAKHRMRPAVIALIDCDLYSSTADVLRFLDPLIVDRSILIMDDWNCYKGDDLKGQRKAFAEFLARRPDVTAEPIFAYGAWGQGFLIAIR